MCPPRVSAISVGRFLDIGGRDSENEVGGFGKTPCVPRFGDVPLALLAFATKLCRLAISGG